MMNLVMFGYFVSTQSFGDNFDMNIKNLLFEERMAQIEEDLPPFGIIDDGRDQVEAPSADGAEWTNFQTPFDPNYGENW